MIRTFDQLPLSGYAERAPRPETTFHASLSECPECGCTGREARVFWRDGAGSGLVRIVYVCTRGCGNAEEV